MDWGGKGVGAGLGGWRQNLGNVGHVGQRHHLAVLLRQLLYQRHLLGLPVCFVGYRPAKGVSLAALLSLSSRLYLVYPFYPTYHKADLHARSLAGLVPLDRLLSLSVPF